MRFLDLYSKIVGTNVTDLSDLPFPVTPMTFRKNDVLTRYGDLEQNVYFINEGIIEVKIRSYTSEKVLDFFFAGEVVSSFTSFLLQIPSVAEMTALTDCQVEVFNFDGLQHAYKTSFQANKLGRVLT